MSSKSVLGRGVEALLPDADDTSGSDRYFSCDIDKIQPNPNQPRQFFDEEKLRELAESIRENGVIQPLLVSGEGGRYTLIAGERRLRAARLAGLDEVPVVLADGNGGSATLELALIENIQRQDLNPIEEAQAYARLVEEFNLTQDEVGRKVGRQRSTIANALRLLTLPASIQQDVAVGALSEGHARVLLRVKDDAERLRELRDRVLAEGLSVRALERLCAREGGEGATARVRQSPGAGAAASEDGLPASYCQDLTTQLTRHLNSRVRIVQQGRKGRLEIEYYSRDDLERLLGLMMN